jgi:hypothetical protein
MSPLLRVLQGYCPSFVRRRVLTALFDATARAFGRERPSLTGLSLEDGLRRYAEFTARHCEEAIERGADLKVVQDALRREGYRLGSRVRERLRLSEPGDVMAAARVLYRTVGIDLAGDESGRIVIARCSFSRRYSAAVCRVMSGFDAGVLTGLAGGGCLSFDHRITEGHPRCLARLSPPWSRP